MKQAEQQVQVQQNQLRSSLNSEKFKWNNMEYYGPGADRMMKIDLHKKNRAYKALRRLKLPKKAPVEPEKDTANPYRMPPRRWFLTFMCMNIPIAGWIYLLCLAFGKKENQLRDFAKAYLVYKLVFLAAALVILGILVYVGLDLADKLLAYMEML